MALIFRAAFPFLAILLCFSACSNNHKNAPIDGYSLSHDIKFEKAKWNDRTEGVYKYRMQMVGDLMNNYQWTGVARDSVVQLLGQPDDIADTENLIMYQCGASPVLGGFIAEIDALIFEFAADSTVKEARISDHFRLPGGATWD